MTPELLDQISAYLARHELYRGAPATEAQLRRATAELGVRLPDDYRAFLARFGGSYVGIPIVGFNNCPMLPPTDVVTLTQEFRQAYAASARWPIIQQSCVVALTGSGDPVILAPTGQVLVYYHDSDTEEVLAASLAELIGQHLPED